MRFYTFIACMVSFFVSSYLRAGIIEDSQFLQARLPFSELDFILYRDEHIWDRIFIDPGINKYKNKYPLINKVKVTLDLDYDYYDDKVLARFFVTNIEQFLLLSGGKRKELFVNCVAFIMDLLSNRITILDKSS